MITKVFQSDEAIHPGESLAEILTATDMSQVDLALRTGLTTKTINEIIRGKSSISPETAIKLASVFGMSADYWNNKERRYQETLTRLKQQSELEKEIKFLKNFKVYSDLQRLGFLPATKDAKEKVKALLSFFGVSSFDYISQTQAVAFRMTTPTKADRLAVAAWLRVGEKKAQEIRTKPFNRKKLLATIPTLRKLSTKKPKEYGVEIGSLLASCGIAVVYVPYFSNTYIYGATRWLTPDKVLIQLSLRYKYEDIFWFSLFHELGHIIKHGRREEFLEFQDGNQKLTDKKEIEADNFAKKTLIPDGSLEQMSDNSIASVKKLAGRLDIAEGIVAGRIAHELSKHNPDIWKKYSSLRTKLELT